MRLAAPRVRCSAEACGRQRETRARAAVETESKCGFQQGCRPVGRRARTAVTLCHRDADDAALAGWWGRWRYAGRVMWALRAGVLRESAFGGRALGVWSGGGWRAAAPG